MFWFSPDQMEGRLTDCWFRLRAFQHFSLWKPLNWQGGGELEEKCKNNTLVGSYLLIAMEDLKASCAQLENKLVDETGQSRVINPFWKTVCRLQRLVWHSLYVSQCHVLCSILWGHPFQRISSLFEFDIFRDDEWRRVIPTLVGRVGSSSVNISTFL